VMMRRGRLTARQRLAAPPGDMVPCTADELPAGFVGGSWATLPLVDMVPYLNYLAGRLTAAGGRLTPAHVASVHELADEASLIVNCSGLGAREPATTR